MSVHLSVLQLAIRRYLELAAGQIVGPQRMNGGEIDFLKLNVDKPQGTLWMRAAGKLDTHRLWEVTVPAMEIARM
jgi:hypothetical protein